MSDDEWSVGADNDLPPTKLLFATDRRLFVYNLIVFEFVLSLTVVICIGALMAWHSLLITKGETSIEYYINKAESDRAIADRRVYRNPYDCGPLQNWIIFLGIDSSRQITFCRHILLPSSHTPVDDGHYALIF